jgi:hypothetical protein
MVVRALEKLRPDAVLIEGPPDAAEVLAMAAHVDMKPPVALLVYEPDQPRNASYYPFADFSPEWQAIRWGQTNDARVSFIDLPQSLRAGTEKDKAGDGLPDDADADVDDGAPNASVGPTPESQESTQLPDTTDLRDPLDQLAIAAGYPDGEAWWGRLIEEGRGDEDPIAVFDSISGAMAELRKQRDASLKSSDSAEARVLRVDPEEAPREAHMRKAIRIALKEHERVAVVCGAWHAPVLTADALKALSAKADDEVLKPLPKRKTTATWVPWTYDRSRCSPGTGRASSAPGGTSTYGFITPGSPRHG